MIPSAELPAAIAHVAGSAGERLVLIAPVIDPKVEAIIRGQVAKGVTVEVVRHPRLSALIADRDLALVLTGSLTPAGTSIGFVPAVDANGNPVSAPNIESWVVLEDAEMVRRLLLNLTSG